ncbi:aminopeptidase [Pseudomonas oryzihabitans]|uniref:PA4642 family protein n=1 Tax=Pseudomonas oryzihabitans TaxID=47885 RepID=UPI00073638A0|nr:PA4642 family protein [Pseudomonas psychrotolerans]KTT49429.1 aminopeptidase [Pseudomonas psychrotolerans]
MRKDKKQVIGEGISDEQIKLFLAVEPADDTPASLHKLVKAYRGLRPDDFERFVGFFVEAGYDLDARNDQGEDFIELIRSHRQAEPYIDALRAAHA